MLFIPVNIWGLFSKEAKLFPDKIEYDTGLTKDKISP